MGLFAGKGLCTGPGVQLGDVKPEAGWKQQAEKLPVLMVPGSVWASDPVVALALPGRK